MDYVFRNEWPQKAQKIRERMQPHDAPIGARERLIGRAEFLRLFAAKNPTLFVDHPSYGILSGLHWRLVGLRGFIHNGSELAQP